MKKIELVGFMSVWIILIALLGPGPLSAQESSQDYTSKVPHYTFPTTLAWKRVWGFPCVPRE